jgi:hypothetical protein
MHTGHVLATWVIHLFVTVFERYEIVNLNDKVIASPNTVTILYKPTSVILSALVWLIIRKNRIVGQMGWLAIQYSNDKQYALPTNCIS